MENAQLQLVDR